MSSPTPLDLPAGCDRKSRQIRPLHYWRIAPWHAIVPAWHVTVPDSPKNHGVYYNHGRYVTNNGHYEIVRSQSGWHIERLFAPYPDWDEIEALGLLHAPFPRRADAVSALEVFVGAMDS